MLPNQWPEWEKTILEVTNYIWENFDTIYIYVEDPDSRNGGSKEPHMSYVLPIWLSSHTMGWNTKMLNRFVSILEAGSCTFGAPDSEKKKNSSLQHGQSMQKSSAILTG